MTFVPPGPRVDGGVLDSVFVDHEVLLKVSFPVARASFIRLTRGGWLSDASEHAYSDGLAGLMRVGPFGDVPGASKLVRVLLLDPVDRNDCTMLPLRWEATGVMGRMFPVLDANLTLTKVDDETTKLTLNGVYRPPLATVGAGLDRALLHKAATGTVRSLIRSMAATLAAPAGAPHPHQDIAASVPNRLGAESGPLP